MVAYNPSGPKPELFKRYQTLNFIEKNLEGLTQEDVDAYSIIIGKFYRWVTMALHVRKEDIIKRKLKVRHLREERQQKIEQSAERESRRETELEASR